MIRPFYRSRLFWLGVPGLVFLMWAWWDSGGNTTGVRWYRGREFLRAEVGVGHLELSRTTELKPRKRIILNPFAVSRDELYEEETDRTVRRRDRQWDFRPAFERPQPESVDPFEPMFKVSGIGIAVWMIVLSYLVLWLGTVWAWQRRKARLLKLRNAPSP